VKNSLFKKISLTTASLAVAMGSLTFISAPAQAYAPLSTLVPPISFNSQGNVSNSSNIIKIAGAGADTNTWPQAVVPFGAVVAGDVLTVTYSLKRVSDNAPLKFVSQNNYGVSSNSFFRADQPTGQPMRGFNKYSSEATYTHTISAADVTRGNFTNFNIEGGSVNNQYFTNYAMPNIRVTQNSVTPTEAQITQVWKKNGVVVTPTSTGWRTSVNINPTDARNFTISADEAVFLTSTQGNQNIGAWMNSGGCIDLSTAAVGQVVQVKYALKKDNVPVPLVSNNMTGYLNLNWSINQDGNNSGTQGVDFGNVNNSSSNSQSVGTLSLPALTQKMLDGVVVATKKSQVMSFWLNSGNLKLDAGNYTFDISANIAGQTKNIAVTCQAADVVNLKATKTATGATITFQEAGNDRIHLASRHFCQARVKEFAVSGRNYMWVAGAQATEVTPVTSPRTFKCELEGAEIGTSYQIGLFNLLGWNGWGVETQDTWLSFKASADVATDATAESIGIGTATDGLAFDPADTTYTLKSTDAVTPYPGIVTSNSKSTFVVKVGGVVVAKPNNLPLVDGNNVVTVEVTSPSGAKKTYTFTITKTNPTADATLSNLAFAGKSVTPAFESGTTSYSTSVASTVTTFPFPTATTSQSGSTYVVKQGGTTVTGPGDLALVDGPNIVTVEVTAPNGTTKRTYTVTINKAPAAKDANLSALPVVAGVTTSPSFDAGVTSYTGSVSESTTTATLSAGNTAISGATTVYKLNGVVVTAPGTLNLRPGANKLETIVTSSDGTTTKTYTQTITRAVLAAGSSTDANDARLAVNPVPGGSYVDANGTTVEGFDSERTFAPNVFTKNVPVNQESLTLNTGGAANSSATIVNEYSTDGGTTWLPAPTPVPLAAGKTTKIRSTVTNGTGTKVYVTDVTRPALDPTASVGPVEGDGDVAPKGIAGTGKFVASNDTTFQLAWTKSTGKLLSQATGIYTGHIEARITFVKGGKTFTCTAAFGTLKVMPQKTAAQKAAAMKMKTFKGKQFCIDKVKLDPRTTNPAAGFTKATFARVKTMNKSSAELAQEKLALAALKGFSGEVTVRVIRYRAWPTTMTNFGDHTGKGGRIPVQIRNTKVTLN